MYLKRLELQGFKSFAQRSELEFGPGISVIVGPNGTGKSNLTDAIRWALGEQGLSRLRSSRLEDVIFSGSDGARPLNYAEVSVTIDNETGEIPVDYSEVTVTRRVYRDGNSEFFINKTPCRLKDITDLFADTGAGRDSWAVVGQGRIEDVLWSRPEERRGLFEEAAGIVKYKNRKREATRKLEETKEKLTRIGDLVAELESRLEPLREEAAKAEAHKSLTAEMALTEAQAASFRLSRLRDGLLSARDREEKLRVEYSSRAQELDSLEKGIAHRREQVSRLDGSISEVKGRLHECERRLAGLESSIEACRGNEAGYSEMAGSLKGEICSLEEKICHEASREKDIREQLGARALECKALQEQLKEVLREAEELEAAISREREAGEAARAEVIDALQKMAAVRNQLSVLQAERDSLTGALRHSRSEREKIREERARLEREFSARKRELEECWAELAVNGRACRECEREIEDKEEFMAERESDRRELAGEMASLEARLGVLGEMEKGFEGFGSGVKAVMTACRQGEAFARGILEIVADIISVPREYERAVEVALGGSAQYIVTDTARSARAIIEYLKETAGGRASFMPLDIIRKPALSREEALAAGLPGAVGRAADLVSYEPRYAAIVEFLLGRTVVAADLGAALRIAARCSFRVKIVTLDGEVVHPGGLLTGGSSPGRTGPGLVARKREMAEIASALEYLRKAVALIAADIDGAAAEKAGLANRLTDLRAGAEKLRNRIARLESEIGGMAEALEKLARAEEAEGFAVDRAAEELAGKERLARDLETELAGLEAEHLRLKEAVSACDRRLAQMEAAREEIRGRITALKVRLASDAQAEAALSEKAESLRVRLEELRSYLAAKKNEAATVTRKLVENRSRLQCYEAEHTRLLDERRDLGQEADALSAERGEAARSLSALEASRRRVRAALESCGESIRAAEVERARYEIEANNLEGAMQERFGTDFPVPVPPDFNEEEASTRISELKRLIAEVGEVNPGSIEEYRATRERYEFLRAQATDLAEASESLYRVIAEMDRKSRERFLESFRAIDSEFNRAFRRLFGGGRARLSLTGDGDPLESGVEITVELPGKKPQALPLLSGGERALVCIALLFAMIGVRPAPFCVLDEVDAALDESNVQRFCDYLKQASSSTQFILVSHQKLTMEIADALYGVTMEKSGVSRLLSVKLGELAAGLPETG